MLEYKLDCLDQLEFFLTTYQLSLVNPNMTVVLYLKAWQKRREEPTLLQLANMQYAPGILAVK
jgi:hypothetical protein